MELQPLKPKAAPTGPRPLAIVVQRFGPNIRGGAEQHAAQLAGLLARFGPVEVLTTTAEDYRYWRGQLPAGEQTWPEHPQVTIRRFPVEKLRQPLSFAIAHRLMVALTKFTKGGGWLPAGLLRAIEARWYERQGPYCPQMVAYLKSHEHRFQRVLFITYLYYPTVMGAKALSVPYLLIPTLHDEPAKDFVHTTELLQGAEALIVNSSAELALIEQLGDFRAKSHVVGIHLAASWWQRPLEAPAEPRYLLYVGRIDQGKNLGALLAWYQAAEFSQPVRLILAGHDQGTVKIPQGVTLLGEVSEEKKVALMAGALAVVHPSRLESLALVVLEALALGTPVLLDDQSELFRSYIKEAAIAAGFRDRASFAAAVEALLASPPPPPLRNEAREWVRARYSEAAIASKFAQICGLPSNESPS